MAGKESGSHGANDSLSPAQRLKHFNGMLVFIMIYLAFCAFNFGFDVGTFGGVQAMHSFTSMFGECDDKNVCALPGWLSSVMTATPFLGKAAGCIACGWIAEKWGRRAAILGICLVSFVGVALQTSATTAAQFTIGRIITFGMTGMAIVVIPIYSAEVSPKVLRGMFASTIQVMIIFGQVISTLVTYGTKSMQSASGWRIPIGLQLLVPAIIFCLLPFLPESPRWLLSRNRRDLAVVSMKKLRKSATDEDIQTEIEALAYAHAHEEKGTWGEVFDKSNRVRTGVAVLAMFGQQITGQAFPSQYGVIFYQSQGYGDRSFLFNVISNIIGMFGVILTWFYIDTTGRRPVIMVGGFLMGVFLMILGGVGSIDAKSINHHEKELMVSSLMLFQFFYSLSWAPCSYVVLSETAALRLKEKTNLFASVISVLTTFVTSFTMPYLINAKYANLGGKVGFIYGSINFIMVVATFFFIPELKSRTLEEVDQLFASGAPLRKFSAISTKSATEMYEEEVKQGGAEVNERVDKVEVA
ncbi:MFS domain-containing protein [Fusarium keratoplasticum]|uniref:MFS domain-containing protein n=1 Tax=Fusarium keratoplasticum TaxID=1328300 RepID=A0ACC0R987_9HYPO|nr:MFS domain-containing protein [Fusarium keratoplasticum]KAI8679864.1 MFS domain-containing protein [Fusarium keratoplasticum]